MEIRTKSQARTEGLARYYTGKPCKRGHYAERVMSSGVCIECQRLASREAYWSNPEKMRQEARERYLRESEVIKSRNSRWHKNNYDKIKKRQDAWRATNKERLLEKDRLYRQLKRSHIKARIQEWHRRNPDRKRAYKAARKATKLRACPLWVDREVLKSIYANCPPNYHVDHIVPLQNPLVCGLHVPANLQYLPASENISKGNRFDPETYVHVFP